MAKKKRKRGYNLKKSQPNGKYGRMRAHETKGMKSVRRKHGSGTTKYKKRAEYGTRKNVKRYKPRSK